MIHLFIYFFKQIYFIYNVFWIFLTELFLYRFVDKDYTLFIEKITNKLANINILYVKIFQSIALNNRFIDDKINNILLKFTDNAPWNKNDICFDTLLELRKEYINFENENENNGNENNDIYNEDDDIYSIEPINSGMISLVFKSYNKLTNEAIIIKLKRKNIEEKLTNAIDNLLFLIKIISYMPFIKKYKIQEIVERNIDIIKHQTDFHEEVENIIKIRRNCENLKYIIIPNVFDKVTKKYPNVIMMEYIEGIKIDQIEKEDYEPFAKQVLKFGIITSIIHGFTHGDLHSGNILFIKDENNIKNKYKIGILDFGIMYIIEKEFKEKLFDVFTNIFNEQPNVTAEKLLLSGFMEPVELLKNLPEEKYNYLLNMATSMLDETLNTSKKANQIQLYKFLVNFNNYLNTQKIIDIGLKPSDQFVKFQLVLAMSHGITLLLCKEDYIIIANKVMNELFHTEFLDYE
jgi:predicted unusual protein kinase regulating ubiquinone biosynthesis (AarF/ABC1/UbiB family)